MSKTVVFFLADFQSGGTEWFALRLARGLVRHGVKPVFLVARAEGELRPLIEREFEIVLLSASGGSFVSLLGSMPAISRFLKKRKPDVFLGGLTILNIIASIAIVLAGVRTRLVVIEHMRLSEQASTFLKKAKRLLKFFFVRCFYRRADKIVAVSKIAKEDLVRLTGTPSSKVEVIYNPIIPDDFKKLAETVPEHIWLQGDRETQRNVPVIVSVGRFLPNKDFSTLIRAFSLVAARKTARLVVFGEGEDRARLEQLVAELGLGESVSLPGQNNNVFAALSRADLFVLSSRSEAFGNVIVEALACGTPVVCTDSGGPSEILEDGRYGKIVPVGNPATLAKAIISSLDEPVDRSFLAARGLMFGVDASTRAYMDIMFSGKKGP